MDYHRRTRTSSFQRTQYHVTATLMFNVLSKILTLGLPRDVFFGSPRDVFSTHPWGTEVGMHSTYSATKISLLEQRVIHMADHKSWAGIHRSTFCQGSEVFLCGLHLTSRGQVIQVDIVRLGDTCPPTTWERVGGAWCVGG